MPLWLVLHLATIRPRQRVALERLLSFSIQSHPSLFFSRLNFAYDMHCLPIESMVVRIDLMNPSLYDNEKTASSRPVLYVPDNNNFTFIEDWI